MNAVNVIRLQGHVALVICRELSEIEKTMIDLIVDEQVKQIL